MVNSWAQLGPLLALFLSCASLGAVIARVGALIMRGSNVKEFGEIAAGMATAIITSQAYLVINGGLPRGAQLGSGYYLTYMLSVIVGVPVAALVLRKFFKTSSPAAGEKGRSGPTVPTLGKKVEFSLNIQDFRPEYRTKFAAYSPAVQQITMYHLRQRLECRRADNSQATGTSVGLAGIAVATGLVARADVLSTPGLVALIILEVAVVGLLIMVIRSYSKRSQGIGRDAALMHVLESLATPPSGEGGPQDTTSER